MTYLESGGGLTQPFAIQSGDDGNDSTRLPDDNTLSVCYIQVVVLLALSPPPSFCLSLPT